MMPSEYQYAFRRTQAILSLHTFFKWSQIQHILSLGKNSCGTITVGLTNFEHRDK